VTAAADDRRVAVIGHLHDPVQGHAHMVAVQEDCGDHVAVDLDQSDAAAHRNRTGGRVEGNVLLLADLAADITEDAGRQRRGQVAALLLRVEDEIVDNDVRVFRDGQRGLVGKQQLGLSAVPGADLLVMNDVVADEQLTLLALRHLRRNVGVHLGGNADSILLGKSRPAEACDPKSRENNSV
jgi:hypothetical protein